MILEVNGVTKAFSGKGKTSIIANDNLSLNLNEGELFGLFGHNGAGKTTLVNQILGLLTPDKGEINLLGKSVEQDPTRARTLCSVQPQSQIPLGFLTPRQAVNIMGKMRLGNKFDSKKTDDLFEALDMTEWADTEGEKLSGGVKRLTAFCMAAVVPGRLVILDEPTNDVDPVRRRYLWQVIRDLTNDGTSVILVTHNVVEAENVVDRVAIMHKGTFLTQGTPHEVKKSISHQMRMELTLKEELKDTEVPSWALSTYQKGARMFFTINARNVSTTIDWVKEQINRGFVLDYTLSPTTMEDAYIELTSGEVVG